MGRDLPVYCDVCSGVLDWGHFGPDPDDPTCGTSCCCPAPGDLRLRRALWVIVAGVAIIVVGLLLQVAALWLVASLWL